MTTATDLPLLAMLGKGTGTPEKPLAAPGDDDRALDAALEFASLLLDAGVAGDDAAGGKTLPEAGGKTLPGQPEPAGPDKPLADAVPADVLEPIIRRELPGALGDAVAGEIRNAQAQPAVLQRASTDIQTAAARLAAAEEAAAGLPVAPGLVPQSDAAAGPGSEAIDAELNSRGRSRQPAPGGLTTALAGQARNGATALGDSTETADAGAQRERPAIAANTDTPPGLGGLARAEAAPRSNRAVAEPTRRVLDAVSALRAEPLAGNAAALPREGATLSSSPAASVPQLAGPDVLLGETGWTRQFAERVGWVIQARVPQAQLSLNPEHLGPIEMSIEVEDAKARVQFTAAHAVTREAIEQSLPRLREMLEQQGLDLAQADVGADPNTARGDGAGDADADSDRGSAQAMAGETDGDDAAGPLEGAGHALHLRPRGLVDTFV